MSRRVALSSAVLLALGVGIASGAWLRRRADRAAPVDAVERPRDLEAAWTRWIDGKDVALPADDAAPGAPASDRFAPERDLFRAVAEGTDASLSDVARRRAGTNAGALAEILLVDRAPDEAERRARRDAFARRYPRSWWKSAPSARSPR